jgi:hypothetical protein
MYDQEDEIIISLCIIIIASVLQRIQRKKRQREKNGYMPGFRGTGNISSTSPRGVPKQKNQHLQFRIEIMPKKEKFYLSKMQIQWLCEENREQVCRSNFN